MTMTEHFELKVAQASAGHVAETENISLVNVQPRSAQFVVTRLMLQKPIPAQPLEKRRE